MVKYLLFILFLMPFMNVWAQSQSDEVFLSEAFNQANNNKKEQFSLSNKGYFILKPAYLDQDSKSVNIDFVIPEDAKTTLRLYSLHGKLVEQVYDQHLAKGFHHVKVDLTNLPTRTSYLYELNQGNKTSRMEFALNVANQSENQTDNQSENQTDNQSENQADNQTIN